MTLYQIIAFVAGLIGCTLYFEFVLERVQFRSEFVILWIAIGLAIGLFNNFLMFGYCCGITGHLMAEHICRWWEAQAHKGTEGDE
jgi:hypothetical protein